MYAVIKAGGKQQRVKPGDVIEVEYMHGLGETVTFQPLLVVDDDGKTHYGKDAEKAVVTAKPLGEQKGEKVRVFKYKNKVVEALREEMAKDKTRSQVFDISPLGLLEVTRKRVSGGLLESFSETCPTCEGRGVLLTYEA